MSRNEKTNFFYIKMHGNSVVIFLVRLKYETLIEKVCHCIFLFGKEIHKRGCLLSTLCEFIMQVYYTKS